MGTRTAERSIESMTAKRSIESMTAKRSIFKDFQRKPLVHLHPRRAQQRSNRFGRPPLPPDHFSKVLGMVHKSLGNGFDQLLHWAPGNGVPGESGDTQISGRRCDYAIFCKRRKLRTVSLGCAPRPIQYLMRSASSLISAGFFSGSYVPTASFTRPSRGRVLSMTTTR